MGFNCGIVGLPNVGKSTLFNALTATAAAAENYPFCTIEPNVGRVAVPDPRLDEIARIAKSKKAVPTFLEFVDIAGLVRGASHGEGLGNQFLSHIREVDAVAHVLRCFETAGVHHVEGSVDPVRDAGTVGTELMLADLATLEKRVEAAAKRSTGGDKEARAFMTVAEPALAALREGRPARSAGLVREEARRHGLLQLITAKPLLYVLNVDEGHAATGNALSAEAVAHAEAEGAVWVIVSARIEAEIAQLGDREEKRSFLETLGLDEPGLDRFIRAGYTLLDLITFFSAAPNEARAWTVRRGARAVEAAGAIHTDFARGFIAAETIAFEDFVARGGEQGAKDAGKMHLEGRDYVVQDGDVILFRFNV